MSGKIPKKFIDDLLSRIDIIDVIDARQQVVNELLGDLARHGAILACPGSGARR